MGGPRHWTRPGRPVFRPRAPTGRHGRGSVRTSAPPSARPPGSASRGPAMPPSSRRPAAILSRSSRPRRRTGCRTSCRCATRGWPSRPSRTTGGRPRSWPSTLPRRPARTSWSRRAATPTSPTSACSPRQNGRWSSTPTTSTRRCPGHGNGTSSDSRRASSSPVARTASAPTRTARRRWRPSARIGNGWAATPACGCSTSGTPRSPRPTSGKRVKRPACSVVEAGWSAGPGSRPSSARLAAETACVPSSR